MCLYLKTWSMFISHVIQFDDVGEKCIDVESGDLDPEEIRSIVHQHNVHRNNIAKGLETRGNPGPQPPGRNIMELVCKQQLPYILCVFSYAWRTKLGKWKIVGDEIWVMDHMFLRFQGHWNKHHMYQFRSDRTFNFMHRQIPPLSIFLSHYSSNIHKTKLTNN